MYCVVGKNNILNLQVIRSHIFNKNVNIPFPSLFQLHFRLRKCKSKDNSKSCQDFFKFQLDKVCDKLAQRNQIWSGFVEDMHIDRKCPLQPVRKDLHSVLPDTYVGEGRFLHVCV